MALRNLLGNVVDIFGTKIGLPEFGVSEFISGGPTANTQPSIISPYIGPGRNLYGGGDTRGARTTGAPQQQQTQETTPQTQTAQSSAPSAPSFDETYAPLFQSLSEQESRVRSEAGEIEASLGKQKGLALEELADTEAERTKQLERQRQDLYGQRTSALSQARRLFNELQQFNLARFGGSTSAGPAAMELLARETARAQGEISSVYARGVADIQDRKFTLGRDVARAKQTLELDYNDKIAEIQREVNSQLGRIQDQRYRTETQKRLDSQNAFRDYALQVERLNNYRLQTIVGLDMWNSQQQAHLNQTVANLPQSLTEEGYNQLIAPILKAPGLLSQRAKTQDVAGPAAPGFAQNFAGVRTKEEQDLLNPFRRVA